MYDVTLIDRWDSNGYGFATLQVGMDYVDIKITPGGWWYMMYGDNGYVLYQDDEAYRYPTQEETIAICEFMNEQLAAEAALEEGFWHD